MMVINALEMDAPNRIMVAIASHACRAGWNVDVVALRAGSRELLQVLNFGATVHVPETQHTKPGLRAATRNLSRLITALRPDVVHASLVRPTLVALGAVRKIASAARPRVVYTHHGAHEWAAKGRLVEWGVRSLLRRRVRLADAAIAVSHHSAQELLAVGQPSQRLHIIPNGIQTTSMPEWHPADPPHYCLGGVGRLHPIKGWDRVLRAMPLLCQHYPQARLEIVGDGPDRGRLEQLAQSLGCADRVTFVGHEAYWMPRALKWDIALQPSLTESFCLAVLEERCLGLPVITSSGGALPELVTTMGTVAIPAPQDNTPEAWADHIQRAWSAWPETARHAVLHRSEVRVRFSSDVMVTTTLELYQKLLSPQSAPPQPC